MNQRTSSGLSRDNLLGVAMLLLGAIALTVGLRSHPTALTIFEPGIEGTLTVGVLASAFPMLAGAPYAVTIGVCAPIFLAQFMACRATGIPFLPVAGVEVLALGLVPFALGGLRKLAVSSSSTSS